MCSLFLSQYNDKLSGMRLFEDLVFSVEGDELLPLFSVSEENDGGKSKNGKYPSVLPILALRNTVLFPGVVIPITIGRKKSIKAVKKAFNGDKFIAVFSQKEHTEENPDIDQLYKIGTVAKIVKFLKMPDGNTTAIIQGQVRCSLESLKDNDEYLEGEVNIAKDLVPANDVEYKATISAIKDISKRIVELNPRIPSEAVTMLNNIKNDKFLMNFIASNLNVSVAKKQDLMDISDAKEKATTIHQLVDEELRLLEVKSQIENKVRGDLERQQRDYFLNQQLKTIQEELGQNPKQAELIEIEKRGKKKSWPAHAKKHFKKELDKAKRINPQVAEYSVTLNYLELMLDLPWDELTEDNFDLRKVKEVLDKDHFGLEDVKERILEHLAVLKLKGDMKAPIVCLVGPPGVGKTSLGKSIASALDRKFVRMSLGGLHDESEIRGHRKTYIGAMPGRIIKSLKKAKSSNPVFILDEIDKIGKDFRGDPSSALLEVLDPEQNNSFHDNYLELDYDLSKVLFIATANSLSTIQPALLDRMEIIEISGYSNEEKVEIAKQHLIPKLRKSHGLRAKDIKFNNKVLHKLIADHTRESGVRSLERTIGSVMRNIAKKVAMKTKYTASLSEEDLDKILGVGRFAKGKELEENVPGVAIGLAWTRVGGDILFIEASLSKGKGKLTLTGNLGDVMKESAATALSYIKANAESLGIKEEVFEKKDIHIHVPEGAIPKDGPSAGITMLSALCSVFRDKEILPAIAMTGEITLRGKVLPVGGIKEKILAAKRFGIKTIILSKDNEKDIKKINKAYLKNMKFKYVNNMSQVLEHALGFRVKKR